MTLEELNQKVSTGEFSYHDFETYYKNLQNEFGEFQKTLEEAFNITRNDKTNFQRLLRIVSGKNSSEIIESLKKLGYKYRKGKNQILQEAFSNMGYRLLEQTRACKRDDVYYSLLRIFISAKENFPLILVEAFKSYYSDALFKIFIFSFLSGILGQEEESYNKEN
ncbi:hypothetical protein [Rosettibacter firmus]|uniref:hypothetical protein n=1 Tax=Rosettibacter firmus TaxID=3111522 RepID=UPI00336BC249